MKPDEALILAIIAAFLVSPVIVALSYVPDDTLTLWTLGLCLAGWLWMWWQDWRAGK